MDGPETVLSKRSEPVSCQALAINYGNMPIDDGHLILSDDEYATAIASEPAVAPWTRRYFGGEEYINRIRRWCLWLVDAPSQIVKSSPFMRERAERVRGFRLSSNRDATNKLALTPTLFGEIRHAGSTCLLIPKVSSENRALIPMGFLGPDAIASGT